MTIWDEVHYAGQEEIFAEKRRDDFIFTRLKELEPKILQEVNPGRGRSWAEALFIYRDQLLVALTPPSEEELWKQQFLNDPVPEEPIKRAIVTANLETVKAGKVVRYIAYEIKDRGIYREGRCIYGGNTHKLSQEQIDDIIASDKMKGHNSD